MATRKIRMDALSALVCHLQFVPMELNLLPVQRIPVTRRMLIVLKPKHVLLIIVVAVMHTTLMLKEKRFAYALR